MKKLSDAAEALPGYLLREGNFEKLKQIRDQLFLLARVIIVASQEEEDMPLQLPRSSLAQCFEGFGAQLDAVLSTTTWMSSKLSQARKRH